MGKKEKNFRFYREATNSERRRKEGNLLSDCIFHTASICRGPKLENDQFPKLRKVSGLIGLQYPYGLLQSETLAIAQPPHRSIVYYNYHSLDHLLFVWQQNILSH